MSTIFGLETGLDLSVGGLSSWTIYLAWIFGFFVLLAIGAAVLWYFNQKKLYSEEVVIFENRAGLGWVIASKDKAKRIRLSQDGTETLFLKNKKIPLSAYGRKMGNNQYWFAIGQDGGYYNFVLGDFDAKMGVLDIEPVDRDIKYVTVALLKNAEKDYGEKKSFMDKWGSWIFSIIWLIIGIAGASYLISQMGGIANGLSSTSAEMAKAVEAMSQIVGRLDILSSGGTGLVSA